MSLQQCLWVLFAQAGRSLADKVTSAELQCDPHDFQGMMLIARAEVDEALQRQARCKPSEMLVSLSSTVDAVAKGVTLTDAQTAHRRAKMLLAVVAKRQLDPLKQVHAWLMQCFVLQSVLRVCPVYPLFFFIYAQ